MSWLRPVSARPARKSRVFLTVGLFFPLWAELLCTRNLLWLPWETEHLSAYSQV